MLKSIYHTGFIVRDVDTSVKFYAEVMGLGIQAQWDRDGEYVDKLLGFSGAHLKGAFLSMGEGHILELLQYVSPAGGEVHVNRNDLGAAHLAFLVDDIEDYYATMSGKGLRFLNPPSYMYQEDQVVRIGMYAQDPDGNWLEFTEIPG